MPLGPLWAPRFGTLVSFQDWSAAIPPKFSPLDPASENPADLDGQALEIPSDPRLSRPFVLAVRFATVSRHILMSHFGAKFTITV